jgi:hypothetical protein
MPDKGKTNFVIDAVMFLLMMAIAGLGVLMKFVLIPGKDRWAEYGRNVELYFLGMDRHQWGTIHLILGCILFVLLALHIILHWKMIPNMYRRLIGSRPARIVLLTLFVVVSILLLVIFFFITPEVVEIGRGEGRHGADTQFLEKNEGRRDLSRDPVDVAGEIGLPGH